MQKKEKTEHPIPISQNCRIFAVNMRRKIYVASSWRNEYYPEVVAKLREAGHDVYDFRNPPSGAPGFKWNCVGEDYMDCLTELQRHKNKAAIRLKKNC
jgi:hypothetical protein